MKIFRLPLTSVIGILAFLFLQAAEGATRTVTNTSDSGIGSLRTTISAAVADDTVVFDIPTNDPHYANGAYTVTLTSGEIQIGRNITIKGSASGNIKLDGNSSSRIFNIISGTLTLTNLILQNGQALGADGAANTMSANAQSGVAAVGGAILNQSTLVLQNCSINSSAAKGGNGGSSASAQYTGGAGGQGAGGGIANQATAMISNCTFENNSALGGAGGFFASYGAAGGRGTGGAIFNDGDLTLSNCTFSGNTATGGAGGGANLNGTVGAGGEGAAVANAGTLSVSHCTVNENVATGGSGGNSAQATGGNGGMGVGGGLFQDSSGSVVLDDTILAGNHVASGAGGTSGLGPNGTAGSTNGTDVDGSIVSQGHNFVGRSDGVSGLTGGDLSGGTTDGTKLDPLFGQLGFYGGLTKTIPLSMGSAAIDAADMAAPARDQRGFVRDAAADIGAYEYLATLPVTLGNISTRLSVQTNDNVGIGGFIITGTAPKTVIVRAIGPSLAVTGALADPQLELHDSTGALLASNDNWMDALNKQAIIDSTVAPMNNLESAILMTLAANNSAYTAIVKGANNSSGVGLVEVYDLDRTVDSKLANISTRGFVQTGDNVVIGGFIVAGVDSQKVIVRAIGPSLPVTGALADPTLELHDGNGVLLAMNDNWRSDQQAEIMASGVPPSNDLESALVETLLPGNYTAIVRGANNGTGVGLVEVYSLQ